MMKTITMATSIVAFFGFHKVVVSLERRPGIRVSVSPPDESDSVSPTLITTDGRTTASGGDMTVGYDCIATWSQNTNDRGELTEYFVTILPQDKLAC